MKIAVLIKQTFDTEARIELNSSGQIQETNVKKIMNPYDEYAVEEAIRIKEAQSGDITVISLGENSTQEVLRQALAMGADKAVLLIDPLFSDRDAFSRAMILADYLRQQEYDLILAGWVSIDEGCAQTPARVADILAIPQVTVISELKIGEGKAAAKRDTDNGTEIIEVPLPALFTVQKGINEPRYPSFLGIMQAKKKELLIINAVELGRADSQTEAYASKIKVERWEMPSIRKECQVLQGEVSEVCGQLVDTLHGFVVR